MIDVIIYTPERVLFKGSVPNVIFPGEQGVFEVLPYHKPLVTRLVTGTIIAGEQDFPIRCGIVGINRNKATVVVEEPA
jgi:F-type H+-transporting ATPase subunit epsilon